MNEVNQVEGSNTTVVSQVNLWLMTNDWSD